MAKWDYSYQSYARGLDMLGLLERPGCAYPVRDLDDYELCRRVLRSLHSSVIGAGSNTWRKHKERYRTARARFKTIPRPDSYCGLGHKNCNLCGAA